MRTCTRKDYQTPIFQKTPSYRYIPRHRKKAEQKCFYPYWVQPQFHTDNSTLSNVNHRFPKGSLLGTPHLSSPNNQTRASDSRKLVRT